MTNPALSRRAFCQSGLFSLAPLAIASLLREEQASAAPIQPNLAPEEFTLAARTPPQEPTAKAMISLFMQGGPSQVDLLDPKPTLNRMDGKKFPGKIKYDDVGAASSKILGSPWKFAKHGECGTEISELLPHTAKIADDILVVRSMHTGVNNHGQSIHALNSGRIQRGRPSLGSWLTYGLGAETQNLPAYVAMSDPKGLPVEGVLNWSNGWLPSLFQGTVIRPKEPRILNLQPPPSLRGRAQENYLAYLQKLNEQQAEQHPNNSDLAARIANYERASRMQTAAREALDISQETKATQEMYGIGEKETDEYGRRCLIARRLVERGVRFVQVFTKNQYWDHHGSIISSLPAACRKTDRGAAALVADLKQRGLLDSTVVHWGGEMGRLPVIQNDAGRAKVGRDHNTYGFSMWLAGGGFRAGGTYGETDEFGHHAVTDIVNHYDYHATLLHLFGLDARALTFKRNAREESLLDGQPGQLVAGLLKG
ncbi:DUF1501 domain-containing protein [Thalassoroseus pseudoceratinae]|uniref:DUF1501 domain-containing protein n=1 Tax=Thalassoroseus pseudoceratinae TaxID=2713176 RepID=UPI00141F32A3|nr:DUF1501 domain-containing protein [Thalassoroseus pseudoceratinae]